MLFGKHFQMTNTNDGAGFVPTEPVRWYHRLALVNLKIRWTDDNTDDCLVGILPVLGQFLHEQSRSAAYDLSCSISMVADDHPRLRRVFSPIARRLNVVGLGA